MISFDNLTIKLFMDGADIQQMGTYAKLPYIKGFTTNPSLLHNSGINNYHFFAQQALSIAKTLPISFEVLADDFKVMEQEARIIAAWGANSYVKIPITNSLGESSIPLIRALSQEGMRLNITAVMSISQIESAIAVLNPKTPSIISIFAGRIADTGRDPMPMVKQAALLLKNHPNIELLWASIRELLNIFHAAEAGAHIITVTPDILKKLPLLGKNLDEFSLETVQMFRRDSIAAGLTLTDAGTQPRAKLP